MYELSDADEFGLPMNILGNHPDEFYGLIGRIICVCAVLEEKVATLRHTLAHAEQGKFTLEPVSAQIEAARPLARDLPEPAAQAVGAFSRCSRGRVPPPQRVSPQFIPSPT